MKPTDKAIEEIAELLQIRTWDQGSDGFGGEWVLDPKKESALRAFWRAAYDKGAEQEKASRIGWQNRAAAAEQKLYSSETPTAADEGPTA
jgi:hypothetical protein